MKVQKIKSKHASNIPVSSELHSVLKSNKGISLMEVLVAASCVGIASYWGLNTYLKGIEQIKNAQFQAAKQKIISTVKAIGSMPDAVAVSSDFVSGPNLALLKCLTPKNTFVVGDVGDCASSSTNYIYLYGPQSKPQTGSYRRILSKPYFGPAVSATDASLKPTYYDMMGEVCAAASPSCPIEVIGSFTPQCQIDPATGLPFALCDIAEVIKISLTINELSFTSGNGLASTQVSQTTSKTTTINLPTLLVSDILGNKPSLSPVPDPQSPSGGVPSRIAFSNDFRNSHGERDYDGDTRSGSGHSYDDESKFDSAGNDDYDKDFNYDGTDKQSNQLVAAAHPVRPSPHTCPNNLIYDTTKVCGCGSGETFDATLVQCL